MLLKYNISTQLSADDIKKFTTQPTASAGLNVTSTLQLHVAMTKHDEASYISIPKTDDSSRKTNFNKAILKIRVFPRDVRTIAITMSFTVNLII